MLENELALISKRDKNKSNKRKKYSQKERDNYYKSWQESGQSKMAFCREHGLPMSSFHKWVVKLASKKEIILPQVKPLAWQTIKVEKRAIKPPEFIELHLASKHYFRLPIGIDLKWLKELLMEVA